MLVHQYLNIPKSNNNLITKKVRPKIEKPSSIDNIHSLISYISNPPLEQSSKFVYSKHMGNIQFFLTSSFLKRLQVPLQKSFFEQKQKEEFWFRASFILCFGFWFKLNLLNFFSFIVSNCYRNTKLSLKLNFNNANESLNLNEVSFFHFLKIKRNVRAKNLQSFNNSTLLLSLLYCLNIPNFSLNSNFKQSLTQKNKPLAMFKNKVLIFFFYFLKSFISSPKVCFFSKSFSKIQNFKLSGSLFQKFFRQQLKYLENTSFFLSLPCRLLNRESMEKIYGRFAFSSLKKNDYFYYLYSNFFLTYQNSVMLENLNLNTGGLKLALSFFFFSEFCQKKKDCLLPKSLNLDILSSFPISVPKARMKKSVFKDVVEFNEFKTKNLLPENFQLVLKNSFLFYFHIFSSFLHVQKFKSIGNFLFVAKNKIESNLQENVLSKFSLWLSQSLGVKLSPSAQKTLEFNLGNLENSRVYRFMEKQTGQIQEKSNVLKNQQRSTWKFFLFTVQTLLKKNAAISQENLIFKLTSIYYAFAYVSKESCTFKQLKLVEKKTFNLLWQWACRRHKDKPKRWIQQKYFFCWNSDKRLFGFYKNILSNSRSIKSLEICYLPEVSQILYHLGKEISK